MAENSMDENLQQGLASDSDLQLRTDGVVTVVLTADNHLGYAVLGQHPRKREERWQRLRQAFQAATDFAVGQGVDLFIQAGDLFDTASPDERDRSFVAERLAQLRQAGIRTFALGGVHDTPIEIHSSLGEVVPAPHISYARLGALHYFAPQPVSGNRALPAPQAGHPIQGIGNQSPRQGRHPGDGVAARVAPTEPVLVDVHGVCVGICGLGVHADQEGDPLAHLHVHDDIERAAIALLILHAPIEGLATGSSLLDTHAQVSRASIANQSVFRYILAGYHHGYRHLRIGRCDVIVAGATQRLDFSDPDDNPGFVFLGLAADGLRWCSHIPVDSLPLRRLVVHSSELWPDGTDAVIERLRPLCDMHTLVQLRLEGELTRRQYHQLDLNQIRRYGEEHCFALTIDDSVLSLLPEDSSLAGEQATSLETRERLSLHEELVALADEWIAAEDGEQEKKAIQATKEELLAALDEGKGRG